MYKLVEFLWGDGRNELKAAWEKWVDLEFVQNHLMSPINKYTEESVSLLSMLKDKIDNGMKPHKSSRGPIQMEPFLLTKQNLKPREKTPEVFKCITHKAKPVPAVVYKGTGEIEKLLVIKEENRRKAIENLEKSEAEKFSVLKRSNPRKKQIESPLTPPPPKISSDPSKLLYSDPSIPVKITTSTILREDAVLRKKKQKEELKVEDMEKSLIDEKKFVLWREEEKLKEEEQKELEKERRKLEVKLIHEDAIVAKYMKLKQNRENAEVIKEESEQLKEKKTTEIILTQEENKKKKNKVLEGYENVVKAKQEVAQTNNQKAAELTAESLRLREKAMREAEEERLRKIELIQQIRILERSIPSVGSTIKIVDLTETAGFGILGEMSIVELQERLLMAKLSHERYMDEKRKEITDKKTNRILKINETLKELEYSRNQRKMMREERATQGRKQEITKIKREEDEEIKKLKAKLEEKRKEREKMQQERMDKLRPKTRQRAKRDEGEWLEIAQAETEYVSKYAVAVE
ncbi:hypothetical protein HK098_008197 [Nowakowskiella sp. JEL0407]|nr:hypothetical protein HK098_008197 [Nowakowskiella sp. JEL0407]